MNILIIDDLSPEDVAMLQALYSRSADSVVVHLEKLRRVGSGKFMQNYVVNYNHKSIADCGDTALFFEGVSLLAAKAIQDWPLYCGQETSTRYVNMTLQPMVDPVNTDASADVLNSWMKFYCDAQEAVIEEVGVRYPRREGENQQVYDRAVKARVFDILRAFLPAGIMTQLSWKTNLRQAQDHLDWLELHPLAEVRAIAQQARSQLAARYPSSGFDRRATALSGHIGGADARAEWERAVAPLMAYSDQGLEWPPPPFMMIRDNFTDRAGLCRYEKILKERPRGCVLPHFFADYGSMSFWFSLDFGSFRDLQRHRNGVCRMPLLRPRKFEAWYLDQLPQTLRDQAEELIRTQGTRIHGLSDDETVRQYYCALGYLVPCRVTYGLPAALYVAELRSQRTVHPTLRVAARQMAAHIRVQLPFVTVHADDSPDDWDVRRGTQTIEEK